MGRGAGRLRPVSRLPAGQPAEARPGPVHADLRGRQPVRIVAEGTDLVAYGFGEQRIVVPAGSVSEVMILGAYHEVPIWSPPILLDRHKCVLLEAPGMWEQELNRVLRSLGLPRPVLSPVTSARGWRHAPGYQRLRVLPPGYPLARGALVVAGADLAGLGASLGVLPALAWLSSETWAQGLAGLAGVAAGGMAGASPASCSRHWPPRPCRSWRGRPSADCETGSAGRAAAWPGSLAALPGSRRRARVPGGGEGGARVTAAETRARATSGRGAPVRPGSCGHSRVGPAAR